MSAPEKVSIENWIPPLEDEIIVCDGAVKDLPLSYLTGASGVEGAVKAYDLGHAALVVCDNPQRLCVLEKTGENRVAKEYTPLRSGPFPNFNKIIKSALNLSIKKAAPLDHPLPEGVMVAADKEGFYLHIPMIPVSHRKLNKIIAALNEPEPQPEFDPTTIPSAQPAGVEAGSGVEGCQDHCTGGETEGRLAADPAADTGGCECAREAGGSCATGCCRRDGDDSAGAAVPVCGGEPHHA